MNDSKAALAAAVAGGYLMGRTKKAKLAFAVGSYLMAGVSDSPPDRSFPRACPESSGTRSSRS